MSSRATGCARACSGRPTPTPRRRRCSTPRTRPGGPWGSTSRAIPSSRPARVTVSTNCHPGSPSTCSVPSHSPPKRRPSPTRPWPSPTSVPPSFWSRVSRWPTRCRATRGGRPKATVGALPRCSSTRPVAWPRWPPMPGSSIWRGGVSSRRASSSPTARRCPDPPCSWRQQKATRTGSASNGASASAGSTPSTREARRRHAPSPSTVSFPAGFSSVPSCRGPDGTPARYAPAARD